MGHKQLSRSAYLQFPSQSWFLRSAVFHRIFVIRAHIHFATACRTTESSSHKLFLHLCDQYEVRTRVMRSYNRSYNPLSQLGWTASLCGWSVARTSFMRSQTCRISSLLLVFVIFSIFLTLQVWLSSKHQNYIRNDLQCFRKRAKVYVTSIKNAEILRHIKVKHYLYYCIMLSTAFLCM